MMRKPSSRSIRFILPMAMLLALGVQRSDANFCPDNIDFSWTDCLNCYEGTGVDCECPSGFTGYTTCNLIDLNATMCSYTGPPCTATSCNYDNCGCGTEGAFCPSGFDCCASLTCDGTSTCVSGTTTTSTTTSTTSSTTTTVMPPDDCTIYQGWCDYPGNCPTATGGCVAYPTGLPNWWVGSYYCMALDPNYRCCLNHAPCYDDCDCGPSGSGYICNSLCYCSAGTNTCPPTTTTTASTTTTTTTATTTTTTTTTTTAPACSSYGGGAYCASACGPSDSEILPTPPDCGPLKCCVPGTTTTTTTVTTTTSSSSTTTSAAGCPLFKTCGDGCCDTDVGEDCTWCPDCAGYPCTTTSTTTSATTTTTPPTTTTSAGGSCAGFGSSCGTTIVTDCCGPYVCSDVLYGTCIPACGDIGVGCSGNADCCSGQCCSGAALGLGCGPVSYACVPAAPTNLIGLCLPTKLQLTWNSSAGATAYDLRVDDQVNGWSGACPATLPDYCVNNWGMTSYWLPFVPGDSYNWWVHGVSGAYIGPEGTVTSFAACGTTTTTTATTTTSTTTTTISGPTSSTTSSLTTSTATTTTSTTTTAGFAILGAVDADNCNSITGWACYAGDFSKQLTISFYKDFPIGTGTLLGNTVASLPGNATVSTNCGGNAAHAFSISYFPSLIVDGLAHTVYVYASYNLNTQLLNSPPASFSCPNTGGNGVLCNSVTCPPPGTAATVAYTYTPAAPAPILQTITLHDDAGTVDDSFLTFTISPKVLNNTTAGHSYHVTVRVLDADGWHQDNCAPVTCQAGAAPSASVCGQLHAICGKIYAAEKPSILPSGILVELRNSLGRLLTTTHTNSALPTNYIFPNLPNGSYFVNPVVGRTQYANPVQMPVQLTDSLQTTADFSIGGLPAPVTVSGSSGTLVLITTSPWTSATPPIIDLTSPSTMNIYSGIIGPDGKTVINVPGNYPYSLTCWKTTGHGTSITTSFAGAQNSVTNAGGGNLMPLNPNVNVQCP